MVRKTKWRPAFDRPLLGTDGSGTHSFPTTDTMYVEQYEAMTLYLLHLNTLRCKRHEGTLSASGSNLAPTGVS
ncbi:hypothetical protein [Kribbella deserti]|uniref:Uncharacterized protein n=1 Tax=Kribbella deserti TaxID=1926257 RepID=A0ABV6QEL6_9ACTN